MKRVRSWRQIFLLSEDIEILPLNFVYNYGLIKINNDNAGGSIHKMKGTVLGGAVPFAFSSRSSMTLGYLFLL
jgi:hypothetical protein